MIVWLTLFKTAVHFTVILCILAFIVYNLYKPEILKPILSRTSPSVKYEPSKYAKVYDNYTFYTRGKAEKLVVWLNGGAFLFSNNEYSYGFINSMFESLENYDIVMIKYSVRFNHTLHDIMNDVNKVLKKFIHYKEYIGCAFSAGVLLMGSFIAKELQPSIAKTLNVDYLGLKFTKFIGINGIYSNNFDSVFLKNLFNFYVLRGTFEKKYYTCYNLNIEKLIIASKNDFLFNQTEKFIATEKSKPVIFERDSLTHNFFQYTHLDETKITIGQIRDFLMAS